MREIKKYLKFVFGMLFVMAFTGAGFMLMIGPLAIGMSDTKLDWWMWVLYAIAVPSWCYASTKLTTIDIEKWLNN